MDWIHLQNMHLSAVIGTLPAEREKKQKLILNLSLGCDMKKAGKSDDLHDAVDYSAAETLLAERVENSSFFLLEALAETLAETCLSIPGVQCVRLRIDKPGAARLAECIGVEIEREKT